MQKAAKASAGGHSNPLRSATFCEGGSTECAPGAAGYLWSTGAVSSCITVDMAGTYSVTLTDAEGCQSECSETVTVNPLPVCGITGAIPSAQAAPPSCARRPARRATCGARARFLAASR